MRTVENPMQELANIQRTIETARKKAERARLSFVAADDATLVAKLTRTNSPVIPWMSWSPVVAQGGTLSVTVGVFNPDPVARGGLFVWAFLGPAGMIADPTDALLTTDPRFPRHQQPAAASGLALSPSTGGSMVFQIPVPAIDPGGYAIHGFLYEFDFFNEGTYLDRGSLPFQVT